MNWKTRGTSHLSVPYHIHSSIKGYEVWLQKDGKYGVLKRELPTLTAAKEFCEAHKANQVLTQQEI